MIVYVISLFMIFFFNDTATTEIYTYGHTLSLHDALPIYDVRAGGTISARSLPNPTNPQAPSILTGVRVDGGGANLKPTMITSQDITFERSEEHTSELQSLMRISYAVFCLKKKHENKQSRSQTSTATQNTPTHTTYE